jgi:ComF family protein
MTLSMLGEIKDALLHLAFPHTCPGCGIDLPQQKISLCPTCLHSLPRTGFHLHAGNPVEKIFWGRIPLAGAAAHYFFSKDSVVQRLMHCFKYRSAKETGFFLGTLMGTQLAESPRFATIDALVPLPLFPAKEKKRGYNQAQVLCEGIAQVLGKPILKDAVIRTTHTDSQTKKSRVERWQNMEGRFELRNEPVVRNRHVLLVDDVVTTGATLEACGRTILAAPGTSLSIATLCYSLG